MMLKRLGALVIAVVLVAAAVLVRSNVIDGDTGSNTAAEVFRLQCGTELEQVCDQIRDGRDDIEVTVADPGATADRLAELPGGEDPGFDAWLTVGPWASITADNRNYGDATGQVLETDPMTLGIARSTMAVLRNGETAIAGCQPDPTWSCVGGLPPGTVRIGLPSPERGDGLIVLASAVSSYFDGEPYDSVALQDPEFQQWFSRLTDLSARARRTRNTPLQTAMSTAGSYNVVGTLTEQIEPDRKSGSAVTSYPDTVIAAPIQLASRAGLPAGDAVDRLGADRIVDALESNRYDPIRGDEQPPPSGLPSPGVLQTLRTMWPTP